MTWGGEYTQSGLQMHSDIRKVSSRLQRTLRSLQANRFLNLSRSQAVPPGAAVRNADFELLRHFYPIRPPRGRIRIS